MARWQYTTPPADLAAFDRFDERAYDSFFDRPTEYQEHEHPATQIKLEPMTPCPPRAVDPVDPVNTVVETAEETFVKKERRRRSMSVHIMQSAAGETDACGLPPSRCINDTALTQSIRSARSVHFGKMGDKTSSVASLQSNPSGKAKYIPDAERIYHLQKDTPERFRTVSRNHIHRFMSRAVDHKRQLTVPQSPALASRTRARPVTALSRKELEDLEVREIKKYKIKANPIPESVIQGIANLAPVRRRPTTKPEPFHLTEVKKRPPPPEPKKAFVARPMPKCILERPAIPEKKPTPVTVPKSPNIRRPKTKSYEDILQPSAFRADPTKLRSMVDNMHRVGHAGVPPTERYVPKSSKPMPFSFEVRDKEREMRKNEKIQKFIEMEKKLREFHANPIPKIIQKKHHSNSSHSSDKKENKENQEIKAPPFKAKPPMILYKPPFIPLIPDRPLLETQNIELTTEKRAKERDNFNQKMKEKEDEREMLRRLKEEKEREEEEKRINALRKQTVHKAAPVKHYPPMIVQPSELPLTRAYSPNFMHRK